MLPQFSTLVGARTAEEQRDSSLGKEAEIGWIHLRVAASCNWAAPEKIGPQRVAGSKASLCHICILSVSPIPQNILEKVLPDLLRAALMTTVSFPWNNRSCGCILELVMLLFGLGFQ